MPKHARRAILAFYQFARCSDDIADDVACDVETRRETLTALKHHLMTGDVNNLPHWAQDYWLHVEKGSYDIRHGIALLEAFIQDTEQSRYADHCALLRYCMRSAAPVGKAVLEVHHEWYADMNGANALCNALQILNHLQDLKADYRDRNRVYFPLQEDALPDLLADESSHAVAMMKEVALQHVRHLLAVAENLPKTINSVRLRAELCAILYIAQKLQQKLTKGDPLARHITLTKWEYAGCMICGISRAIVTRTAHQPDSRAITSAAGTSFFWPMRILSKAKRQAMFAFYAFCRVSDDTVDEASSIQEAADALAMWQADIAALYADDPTEYPEHPRVRALLPLLRPFNLPNTYFDGMLHGYAMDIDGVNKPTWEALEQYCYGVASCVGLLSMHIFGFTQESTKQFAIALGQAMQHINIIRDIENDAKRGRIYLPKESLEKHGLADLSCTDIIQQTADPEALRHVIKAIGEKIAIYLEQATSLLPEEDQRTMRPALLMRSIYIQYFDALKARDWNVYGSPIKLTRYQKARFLWQCFGS